MDDLHRKLNSCLKKARKTSRIGKERVWANEVLYSGEGVNLCNEAGRDAIARAFLITLEHRQRTSLSCTDFQRFYFYIAKNGRLAYVARQKAQTLIKRGKIVNFKATEEIKGGVYVKHRRIIADLNRSGRQLYSPVQRALEYYFDEQLPCKMIIDTNFKIAYEPTYYGCMSTDGDLANEESCMSGRGDEAQLFYGGIHGCKVVRFETEDGEQVGRCIMYEYNDIRHFIRIYGRGSYHRTMLNFIKDNMKENDLFGRSESIKGLRLKADWDDDTPNMYLDGSRYGITKTEDGWVVTTDFEYNGKNTSDETLEYVYEEGEYYTCERCGRRVHRDDAYFCGDYAYCDSDCAAADGWCWCERCGECVWEGDGIHTKDGKVYCCESCAKRDGYTECPSCGKWKNKDDMFSSKDGAVCMCNDCIEDDEIYELDDDNYIVLKKEYRGVNDD